VFVGPESRADARGQQFDRDDDDEHHDDARRGLLILEQVLSQADVPTDSARAHDAEADCDSGVDFEDVEGPRDVRGRDLTQHPEADDLRARRPGRLDGLDGTVLDLLQLVGEQPTEVPDRVGGDGQHCADLVDAGQRHVDEDPHQRRDGSDGAHHAPEDEVERERRDLLGTEDAEEQRQREAEHRAGESEDDSHHAEAHERRAVARDALDDGRAEVPEASRNRLQARDVVLRGVDGEVHEVRRYEALEELDFLGNLLPEFLRLESDEVEPEVGRRQNHDEEADHEQLPDTPSPVERGERLGDARTAHSSSPRSGAVVAMFVDSPSLPPSP